MLSRLSGAALSGTRIDRNTIISSRNDTTTTASDEQQQPVLHAVAEVGEVRRLAADVGDGVVSRPAPAGTRRRAAARRSSRVAASCGAVVGIATIAATPRPRRSSGGATEAMPGSAAIAAASGSTTDASPAMSTAIDAAGRWCRARSRRRRGRRRGARCATRAACPRRGRRAAATAPAPASASSSDRGADRVRHRVLRHVRAPPLPSRIAVRSRRAPPRRASAGRGG